MRMKAAIMLLVVLLVTVGLAGCSRPGGGTTNETVTETATDTGTETVTDTESETETEEPEPTCFLHVGEIRTRRPPAAPGPGGTQTVNVYFDVFVVDRDNVSAEDVDVTGRLGLSNGEDAFPSDPEASRVETKTTDEDGLAIFRYVSQGGFGRARLEVENLEHPNCVFDSDHPHHVSSAEHSLY